MFLQITVFRLQRHLLSDLKIGKQGQHASNLGGILAREIGDSIGVPSYIVDPVVVDELEPTSRYSGVPELPRTSVFHALNQKAVAKRYAKECGRAYDSLNLVVVHMGGGVSVGAHKQGKVVDVFNALDGDGAFSPERAGAVPSGALIKMCFSGQYTEKEVYKKIVGGGGFNAYCNTNDMRDVEKMVQGGDTKTAEIREAFISQVAKDIGSMACVLNGKVDQIIVTGGIAYDKVVVAGLKEKAEWIAPMTGKSDGSEDVKRHCIAKGASRNHLFDDFTIPPSKHHFIYSMINALIYHSFLFTVQHTKAALNKR